MMMRGVVVRYRGSMLHCTDCVRVTIGTESENDVFLTALLEIIGQRLRDGGVDGGSAQHPLSMTLRTA